MIYIIESKGRKHRYATLAKATQAASDILNATGIVVGITEEKA